MHKKYTGLLYISSVARFCTNASCFDGHSRSMSHKNQSAVLLKAIISGTVHFLPIAIPCTLTYPSSRQTYPSARATYPSKRCGTGKVKLYQFRSFDFDFPVQSVGNHPLEAFTVLGVGAGDTFVYLNAVFDTNGKASSGAQSAGKGLISWAFAVLPIYPTGLRKPCFSFQ